MSNIELLERVLSGLDRMGYSKERAMHRVKIYDNATKGSTVYHSRKCKEDLEVIISGSRREGLANFWESDIDEMIVPERVVCTETGNDYGEHVNLTLDFEGAPAGYTFLKLASDEVTSKLPKLMKVDISQRGIYQYLKNTSRFCSDGKEEELGTQYQSATDMDSGWMTLNITEREITGPALPFLLPMPMGEEILKYDQVLALKYYSSEIEKWCVRERKFNWPSQELVERCKVLDAHVVPTGVRGSEDEHLQWRICYTLAEIELVQSFNDVQIKVYAVLKLLAKDVLDPALKTRMFGPNKNGHIPGMSYIMKNIMFWISEDEPIEMFTEELFADRLLQAVLKLKKGIKEEDLPNYMVPARNLCTEKLTFEHRQILLSELQGILKEGFGFVRRIPKIAQEITNQNQEELVSKAMQRNMEEQFLLSTFTLPPEQLADVMVEFHAAETREECVLIYKEKVLPHIRHNTTSQMFEQFSHMTDDELFEKLLSSYERGCCGNLA